MIVVLMVVAGCALLTVAAAVGFGLWAALAVAGVSFLGGAYLTELSLREAQDETVRPPGKTRRKA